MNSKFYEGMIPWEVKKLEFYKNICVVFMVIHFNFQLEGFNTSLPPSSTPLSRPAFYTWLVKQ